MVRSMSSLILDPQVLVKELDKTVVGQQQAKRDLSLAVVNRQLNFQMKYGFNGLFAGSGGIDKNVVLFIGKSGTGKTLLVHELSKVLNVPYISIDCSFISPQGWAGTSIETYMKQLYDEITSQIQNQIRLALRLNDESAHLAYNPEKDGYASVAQGATKAIVFLDEIDKLVFGQEKSEHASYYEAKQYNLLKIIEGTTFKFGDDVLNTKDILFVLGGAFTEIDNVLKTETTENAVKIGFFAHPGIHLEKANRRLVTKQHLIKYGLVPELVNRITVISKMEDLTRDIYRKILTTGSNSLVEQYKRYFRHSEVILTFSDDSLDEIADEAVKRDEGARVLKELMYHKLEDYMFNISSHKNTHVHITAKNESHKIEEPRKMAMSL